MPEGPKILAFDIETAPAQALVFSAYKPFVTPKHIIEHPRMLCFSAQWYGQKKVMFYSEFHHSRQEMLEKIAELLDEADIVVHYNGTNFDEPWIRGELLVENIEQPSPFKTVDLYRAVRSGSRFISNKLEYVAPRLLEDSKVTHEGIEMWWKCMNGDEKAWSKMRQYAKHDTAMMFPLYERLRPIMKTHPNLNLYREDGETGCPWCGSTHLRKRGVARTASSVFQRYQCQAEGCKRYFRGTQRIGLTDTRPIT